jgi:hypothetical protein
MSQARIWTGTSTFTSGSSTPFGIYDSDSLFQVDAPKVASWCAKRLGYPIIDVELQGDNFFAVFEEAVSEYSAQVNQFNIRNNLGSLEGQPTGSNYTGQSVLGSELNNTITIAESYGNLANVGGRTDIKKGYINVNTGSQEPTTNYKLWFEYQVVKDRRENSTIITPNVVSDYSNIGYNFAQYNNINDVGKQWIRKYTLALAKEMLGAIREKYNTVPIPGSEVSLDGAALRAEAQTEKDALIEQLRENLNEVSKKQRMENEASMVEQQQQIMNRVPLNIYIG